MITPGILVVSKPESEDIQTTFEILEKKAMKENVDFKKKIIKKEADLIKKEEIDEDCGKNQKKDKKLKQAAKFNSRVEKLKKSITNVKNYDDDILGKLKS